MFNRSPQKKEPRPLNDVLADLLTDADFLLSVEAFLSPLKTTFPFLASALALPQSADLHAEGPRVEHHVRQALLVLFAITTDKLALTDFLEVVQMRGFETEWLEIERAMKESSATLRTAILLSQLGKPETAQFIALADAPPVSKTFLTRSAYEEAFNRWEAQQAVDGSIDLSRGFFLAYRVSVQTPNAYEHLFAKDTVATFEAVALQERLTEEAKWQTREMVLHLGSALSIFSHREDAGAYERFLKLLQARKIDEEPFVRLLQALMFCLFVAGTMQSSAHGVWHDMSVVESFLRAEHSAVPARRALAEKRFEEEKKRIRQKIFQELKLDGAGLLELFQMKPGPEFGRLLHVVQKVARGEEGELPKLDSAVHQELIQRLQEAHTRFLSL